MQLIGLQFLMQYVICIGEATIKWYFTVNIIICGMSSDQKIKMHNNYKSIFINKRKYFLVI